MKQREAWEQLSSELNGEYIESKAFKVPRVILPYKNFKICLDTYTVSTGQSTITYTRMRTIFINKPEFTFKTYKEGFFAKIGKALGMADIEIGDVDVDKKLIIKSPDEYLVKDLLIRDDVKAKLLEIKNINLQIEKKFYEDAGHMYRESTLNQTVTGVIKDVELLKSWYYLFTAVIDGMMALDITEDTAPENIVFKDKQLRGKKNG